MINVFIEVTNGPQNWGKFMIARFEDEEWRRRSTVMEKDIVPEVERAEASTGFKMDAILEAIRMPLLGAIGWSSEHIIVFDLQTCEGAAFLPGGYARADLEKHKIWVCPMFEPFLGWLYKQDLSDLTKLPKHVDLPYAPFAISGYRRSGKSEV